VTSFTYANKKTIVFGTVIWYIYVPSLANTDTFEKMSTMTMALPTPFWTTFYGVPREHDRALDQIEAEYGLEARRDLEDLVRRNRIMSLFSGPPPFGHDDPPHYLAYVLRLYQVVTGTEHDHLWYQETTARMRDMYSSTEDSDDSDYEPSDSTESTDFTDDDDMSSVGSSDSTDTTIEFLEGI
jgi:hypothetical protein